MIKSSNSKPRLIMVIGLPGSGKTYFAQNFSDEYKIPFLNINQIRHQLIAEPTYNKTENQLLNTVGVKLLLEIFKTNCSVIVESDFSSRVNRQAFSKLAHKHNYQPMIIWVQTDVEESEYRATTNNPQKPKDFLIDETVFAKISKTFTAPNKTENYTVISGKHPFKSQYKIILKNILK